MSDATERPSPHTDPDAWATACEEDLADVRARRRERYGTPPGSAAEELRRLADAVAGKLAEIGAPLAGPAARATARQFVDRARAAAEPVVERNPRVFDHLAAAGSELLAAYRAAVEEQERRWTQREDVRRGTDGGGTKRDGKDEGNGRGDGEGPAGSERIDLD